MAQSFSLKKYLSKIHAPALLSELIKHHGEQAFFDINDQTPRKLAVQLMEDSIKSLDTEKRLEVMKELSYVSSITNPHTARLGKKLFKKNTGKDFEPEIECASDHDLVLYFHLKHEDVADRLAFLHPYYASKSYLSYEAKNVDDMETETKLTELGREFTRLANKEDNATEQHMEHVFVDGVLFVTSTFHEGYNIEHTLNHEGETDRKAFRRKIQTVRIAYIPDEEVVLLSGNISKQQKMLFLDTFLRVVTGGGYEAKEESYDLVPLKNLDFDFAQHNRGTPFIKANIKSVTLSYADGKKKLRIALPSSREHSNLQALKETLDELGLTEQMGAFSIANMAFGFMFQDKEKENKAVNVSCSLSPNKATLCPLFEYERYTKSILKNAGMYEGYKLVGK